MTTTASASQQTLGGKPRYPLALPSHPLKRWIAVKAGWLLSSLLPRHSSALLKGERPLSNSLSDRLTMAYLVDDRLKSGRMSELNHFHEQFWKTPEIVALHAEIEKSFEYWLTGPNAKLIEEIERATRTHPVSTVCEIGSGNGRALQFLAELLYGPQRFIGIDLSDAQTDINRTRYAGSQLEFVCAEATAWITQNAKPGWFYFSYGGVLEYLTQPQLESLLGWIKNQAGPATFAIAETVGISHDFEKNPDSEPYGYELSFSHNYRQLFQRAGYTLDYYSEHRSEGIRYVLMVSSVGWEKKAPVNQQLLQNHYR
jgi:SAM-dependent methyltransferase